MGDSRKLILNRKFVIHGDTALGFAGNAKHIISFAQQVAPHINQIPQGLRPMEYVGKLLDDFRVSPPGHNIMMIGARAKTNGEHHEVNYVAPTIAEVRSTHHFRNVVAIGSGAEHLADNFEEYGNHSVDATLSPGSLTDYIEKVISATGAANGTQIWMETQGRAPLTWGGYFQLQLFDFSSSKWKSGPSWAHEMVLLNEDKTYSYGLCTLFYLPAINNDVDAIAVLCRPTAKMPATLGVFSTYDPFSKDAKYYANDKVRYELVRAALEKPIRVDRVTFSMFRPWTKPSSMVHRTTSPAESSLCNMTISTNGVEEKISGLFLQETIDHGFSFPQALS